MYSLYNSVNLLSPQNNQHTAIDVSVKMSKLGPISHFLSPVSCDLGVNGEQVGVGNMTKILNHDMTNFISW